MSMRVPLWQVDAFTTDPFRGNPAAVCRLAEERSPAWMQAVAAELNLSETAFVLRRGAHWTIRWFTPATEVPLCGHATLASAHVLWTERELASDEPIEFQSLSGPLGARREGEWVCLDFPALPSTPRPAPGGLCEALGVAPASVRQDAIGVWLVELESAAQVRELKPDFRGIQAAGVDCCLVTAPGDGAGRDFVSRFFAPGFGIDEDPVTGSAHCTLAPFWAARLGRNELTGEQLSRRTGVVRVRVRGDRVDLLGQAITVFRGELLV